MTADTDWTGVTTNQACDYCIRAAAYSAILHGIRRYRCQVHRPEGLA